MADDELKRIHTFQSDVEELMQKEQVSKADIALAEQARQTKLAEAGENTLQQGQSKIFRLPNTFLPAHRSTRLIVLIATGVLVLGGVGAWALFPRDAKQQPPTALHKSETEAAAIVLQEGERRTGALRTLRDGIAAISVPQNEMRTVALQQKEIPVTTSGLFALLETSVPPALARALGSSPTFGIHGLRGGQTFLLFSVASYDHAFAGMLAWEETLLDDVGPVFGVSPRVILAEVGSTTADALQNQLVIKDVIIRNKDARAAFDPSGGIVFLYSFIDKQTLVLTTNEETLKMLIGRAGGGKLR